MAYDTQKNLVRYEIKKCDHTNFLKISQEVKIYISIR